MGMRATAVMSRIFDRQTNPTTTQGIVTAGAAYDTEGQKAIIRSNKLAPSLYQGGTDEANFGIEPSNLLFTLNANAATRELAVLSTVNGLGSEATLQYPDDEEFVAACARNQIQYIGKAYQALSHEPIDKTRGITVQLSGLATLPIVGSCKPGDKLEVFLPPPGKMYFSAAEMIKRGIPPGKVTLLVRKASTATPGTLLHTHIRKMLDGDPQRWKLAMGERLLGTAMWATAAHEVMTSALVNGLLFLRSCLLKNIVGRAANSLQLAPAGVSDDEFIARLATKVGAIDGATINIANVDQRRAIEELRLHALQSIFYNGEKPQYEVGAPGGAGGAARYAGRTADKKTINMSSDVGKLLDVQLNHMTRAVSSYYDAILDSKRMIIGTSTTGGSQQGSGNTHAFLSKIV